MAMCQLRQHGLPRFDFLHAKPEAGHTLIRRRHCWLGNPRDWHSAQCLSSGALHDSHSLASWGTPMSLIPTCWSPQPRSIVGAGNNNALEQ